MTFPFDAKKNFDKKESLIGSTNVQTPNHANDKSMHNHSTNSRIILSIIMIHHIIKIIIN